MPKQKKAPEKQPWTLQRAFPILLVVLASIGLLAAFDLTVEKFSLLKNPDYVPTCNISPILSCGSVMKTETAEAFGFANSLIGLVGFAVVITIGVGVLAGATYKKWFWVGLQLGTIFGVGFVHWLFYNSLYNIGALCPYCMVVWAVTIPIFWYTLLYNLREENIRTPEKLRGIVGFMQRHHVDILVVWFLILIGLILERFWYYWSSLI
jgi:uncharacterized membrane protein